MLSLASLVMIAKMSMFGLVSKALCDKFGKKEEGKMIGYVTIITVTGGVISDIVKSFK